MGAVSVIYEDKELLVINKSAGIASEESPTQKEPTLTEIIKTQFGINLFRSGLVHRLDKNTSGIMVVAKTQNALNNLQSQFKERITKKEYLALVHGVVESDGEVEGSIGRNPGNREKFTVLEDVGKEALTKYSVLENLQISDENFDSIFNKLNKIQKRKLEKMRYNLFTLLSCHPHTGRTHQIRVHLKHIGHPIVADEKYAGRKVTRLDKRWCARIFLHAKLLGFNHPESGEWMEFECPLPEDLASSMSLLKIV